MQDLLCVLMMGGLALVVLGGVLFAVLGSKADGVTRAPAVASGIGVVLIMSSISLAALVPYDVLTYPYSTYIEYGETLVEGEKVVERLPDKFQEAVSRLRFAQKPYSLHEASVKNKLKGDGIQQDHTIVWLNRHEEGSAFGWTDRRIFVGISHDIVAKVERVLRIELSEDELKEMLGHFPGEFREPIMSVYASGDYKAYGLGPTSRASLGGVSEICGIQLIKERQLPVDIANQRQRIVVDEVDLFIEDMTIVSSVRP